MNLPGTVAEVLSNKRPELWSVTPRSTVLEAVQMMSDKNVGALPILDGSQIVGMISERDYTRKVILKGRSSRDTVVEEIMMRDMPVATEDSSIVDCMRVMTERKVRHLPVLKDEELIGIVSIGDLVNWIISAQTATIDHLERYLTGEYPT